MKAVVSYVRSLLGWCEEPNSKLGVKRDRIEDDLSSDDEPPTTKRFKTLKRSSFPTVMSNNDNFNDSPDEGRRRVRYVPIVLEDTPSTSTPVPGRRPYPTSRAIPLKLADVWSANYSGDASALNTRSESSPNSRRRTPSRMVKIVTEDDDDDPEITWIEPNTVNLHDNSLQNARVFIECTPSTSKQGKSHKIHKVEIEDDEDDEEVIFVKKMGSSTRKSTDNGRNYYSLKDLAHDDEPCTMRPIHRMTKSIGERLGSSALNHSPRKQNRFKTPSAVSKGYKVVPQVAKWLNPARNPTQLSRRNVNMTSQARAAISEAFDLEEKRNYRDLIKRMTLQTPFNGLTSRSDRIQDLLATKSLLKSTQQTQKRSMQLIDLTEDTMRKNDKSLSNGDKQNEYDPITVACINSSDSEVELVGSTDEASTSSSVQINPINSFKISLQDKAVAQKDWLGDINKKYKQKRDDKKEKLKDASFKSNLISRMNHEQYMTTLEQKLKLDLKLPASVIEELSDEEPLPELTEQQNRLIKTALHPNPPNQVLIEKFNLRITRRDLQTLAALNWLNDEVINFYMNLLMQRSQEKSNLPKVYAANTFFYPKLMQTGQAGLKRWTRKVDIFAHDLLVVPVHLGVHWCMSIVDFRDKTIKYLDSMGGRNMPCCDALLQYLVDEMKDKKKEVFDTSEWKKECVKDIPQQMNGSDCGMFSCTFAEFISRNAPITFNQADMPYLRRKMVLEIIQGKLLL